MEKMLLLPDADGYSSTDGIEVISVQLDGGAGRYRTDKIGAAKTVNVKWTMNPLQYQYWRAFYLTTTKKGALSFLCDLVSDDGQGPAEHVCNFVPGSVTLPTQMGLTYVQQAVLEVKPLPRDETADASILLLFELYGDAAPSVLAALAKLVNVDLPS